MNRRRCAILVLVVPSILGLATGFQARWRLDRTALPQQTAEMPAPGDSYVDPVFGTTIRRVTGGEATGSGWSVEYSKASPWSVDGAFLLLTRHAGGEFGLFDGDGTFLRILRDGISLASMPRWLRSEPHTFVHSLGSELRTYDVDTDAIETLEDYDCQLSLGHGEEDVSEHDGREVVVTICNLEVGLYDLTARQRLPMTTVTGPFDNAWSTPDADGFVVDFTTQGDGPGKGRWLFDRDARPVRQLMDAGGHGDAARTVSGEAVYVYNNSGQVEQPPGTGGNSLVMVRFDGTFEPLIRLEGAEPNGWNIDLHVSGNAEDGWLYVSTFPSPSLPTGEWTSPWEPFFGELFRVRMGGPEHGTFERIAHVRSSGRDYWAMPKGSVSADGTRVAWTSTWMAENRETDVYMAVLEPGPTGGSRVEPGSRR